MQSIIDFYNAGVMEIKASESVSVAQSFFNFLVTNPTVSDVIFSYLSPTTILRFSTVSHAARRAVRSYFRRVFNINHHLSRFFSNPRAFRSLQARTGTLISGSNALQLLDRTFYPESDLDIYVAGRYALEVAHWLLGAGYVFSPTQDQANRSLEHNLRYVIRTPPETMELLPSSEEDIAYTAMRGVCKVCNFTRPVANGASGEFVKVQLIVADYTPIEIILHFHSTCVMNLISFEKAYSLYPRATFEERRALIIATAGPAQEKGRQKYIDRGWLMVSSLSEAEISDTRCSFYLGSRWLGDRKTWTVPLDMDGVEIPSLTFGALPCDSLATHSWTLDYNAQIAYSVLASPALEYFYVINKPSTAKFAAPALLHAEHKNWTANDNQVFYYDIGMSRLFRSYYELQETLPSWIRSSSSASAV